MNRRDLIKRSLAATAAVALPGRLSPSQSGRRAQRRLMGIARDELARVGAQIYAAISWELPISGRAGA